MDSLKVLVIGYYGHQNAGDDLLRSSMDYIFQDHNTAITSWQPSTRTMNEADLLVIGGGSIWPDFPFFQQTRIDLARLSTPICIIGISARHQAPDLAKTTDLLIEKAIHVHVRDAQSKEWMGNSSKIEVGADLFWWVPWEPIDETSQKIGHVALSLRDVCDISWQPRIVLETVRDLGLNPIPFPFYYGSPRHDARAEVDDAKFLANLGLEHCTPPWSYWPALKAEIVIAMRYHAILVAIRLGRLVVGLNCHPKIASFFDEVGMPELCVAPDDYDGLKTALMAIRRDRTSYANKFESARQRFLAIGKKNLEQFQGILSNVKPRSSWFPWQ